MTCGGHQWHLIFSIQSMRYRIFSLPLNCFQGLQTRMNTGFLCMGHLIYRHIYRQKTNALTGAGDALGLCGDYSSTSIINYRGGSGSPSESLHPTFFHSRTSIKQRFLITKRYTSSVFQPMKPKVKGMPAPTTLFLARPMATFMIEFLLLHFTLNSSPRGKQACR